jgi:hypothetical protein
MGAEFWQHQSTWHQEAAQALQEIQARMLAEEYDLAALIPEHLANARETLAHTRAEGDPYDLAELYETEVAFLEGLSSEPLPPDTASRLLILRRLYANSGEGIGNVLDVESVSPERELFAAQPLDETETQRLIGAARPTAAQVHRALEAIANELGRGECICFPVYDDSSRPVGWQFLGYTVD